MLRRFEEGKELIINAVIEKLQQKMRGEQAALCVEFTRQFFSTASLDDLRELTIDDLYGAAVNFWDFIKQRVPNEIKIRIYNPDTE